MKKLAFVALLVLVAFGFTGTAAAETEPAATAGPYDVLNLLGYETPGWMLGQDSTSTSVHPGCFYNPAGCNYRLVGCCCVSSNIWCDTYCI